MKNEIESNQNFFTDNENCNLPMTGSKDKIRIVDNYRSGNHNREEAATPFIYLYSYSSLLPSPGKVLRSKVSFEKVKKTSNK